MLRTLRTKKVSANPAKRPPSISTVKARSEAPRALVFLGAEVQMKPFATVEAAAARIGKDVKSLVDSQAGEMYDTWVYLSDGRLLEARVLVELVPVEDPKELRKALRFIEVEKEYAHFMDVEAAESGGGRKKRMVAKFEDFKFPIVPAPKR